MEFGFSGNLSVLVNIIMISTKYNPISIVSCIKRTLVWVRVQNLNINVKNVKRYNLLCIAFMCECMIK